MLSRAHFFLTTTALGIIYCYNRQIIFIFQSTSIYNKIIETSYGLNTIPEIIEDIRAGKMVILMDDEDRENEAISLWQRPMFTLKYQFYDYSRARFGLFNPRYKHVAQLALPLMSDRNEAKFSTNFTVSIERLKASLPVSLPLIARTIQAAVASAAKPEDIVQPGHIFFPIMAQNGGVFGRASHTEAGLRFGTISRVLDQQQSSSKLSMPMVRWRRDDFEIFAKEHGIKMGVAIW